MSWDSRWEDAHRRRPWGRYPPEELVRFVTRTFGAVEDRSSVRFLDVGCGTGAAAWFLAREGYQVSGVDGSFAALRGGSDRAVSERVAIAFVRGDLSRLPFADHSVDCVVDVHAIQHNRRTDALAIMDEIIRVLRGGGRYFGLIAASGTTLGTGGEELGDGTYAAFGTGPFAGLGVVRFYDENAVGELLRRFQDVTLDRSERTQDGGLLRINSWVASAQKA